MTGLDALLAPIRERLNAVTEKALLPWRRVQSSTGDGTGVIDSAGSVIGYGTSNADAELLAHAPTDQARLLAAIDGVTALHKPSRGKVAGCEECDWDVVGTDYPCPTITALTEALGKEQK